MEKINKSEKSNENKRRKKNPKRQISIFTIMLWVFLVSIMITITVNSIKNINLLEIEDENWNIGLVMYDRSSDTPTQAITEFTWNAESEEETKQLCMQINYACTTNKGYQPGELEIMIPGISKSNFSEYWKSLYSNNINSYEKWLLNNVIIAADKTNDTTKKYDWSYSYDIDNNIYTFINNKVIEENEHFEGTIQVVYNLLPKFRIKTDLEFRARLKKNIENTEQIILKESNICNFHYTSIKKEYKLKNNAVVSPKKDYTKIEDILQNYYWVQYDYNILNYGKGLICALDENGKKIYNKDNCIKLDLPEGVILYDNDLNKIEARENNTYYYLEDSGGFPIKYYYVGYPKSIYNEGYKITNIAQLWGRYEDEEKIQKLAEDEITLNLADFDFEYKGELYKITKSYGYLSQVYKSQLKSGDFFNTWKIDPTAFYTGSIMDVEIGDDLLYITRENGEITKLSDEEYNFKQIKIPVFYTCNKYGNSLGDSLIGYNYEVQVRYRDKQNYEIYKTGITSLNKETVKFNRDDIVGVKLIIRDLDKTLYTTKNDLEVYTNIYPSDFKIGKLYNFCSLQVYITDENGNKILHNNATLDNYKTEISKLEIAKYDMNKYGRYIHRGESSINIYDGFADLSATKERKYINNNVKDESYEIRYMFSNLINLNYYNEDKDLIVKQYDILPLGMELVSSKEEIINSIALRFGSFYENLKLEDGFVINSKYEFENYIRKHTVVDIDYNYKESGRTKVSIIYNFNGVDFSYYSNDRINIGVDIYIDTKIPYDSISEYGTKYTNYVYTMWNNQEHELGLMISSDNGKYDPLASDIDSDGDTEEKLSYAYNILNITHAVSSQQTVIKQVRTDLTKGKFVGKIADATAGSKYTYKLRVTTGANSLKDLILYDTLETIYDEQGNDISSGWKGKFLGVDTSYAISMGYVPKVYYSEEKNPGKLTEVPDKWKELTDDVDKTKVKSICVDLRYKADGTEMELSANNVVYVLINMQAPEDESILTSANNMFSTNWRAVDPLGETIDNVEGIYSNQVSVEIFKEVNRKQNIVGVKVWIDEDNKYKIRPENITVKLLQDGIEYDIKEVSKEDEWKYVFKNVPVYKNDKLEEYEYSIEEVEVQNYEATYDGYNIINTFDYTKLRKNITGKKTWRANYLTNIPKSITVKLLQDGIEYIRKEVTKDDNWNYTFENVPIYKNDKLEEYEYSVEEVEVPGYETIYNEYNITNKLKTIDLEITKIWEDNENENLLRPKFVLIKVFDGEKLIDSNYVRDENNWKCTFYNLPEIREDGTKIEYRVDEEVEKVKEEYFGGGIWEYEENFENESDFELYKKYYVKSIVGNTITNKYINLNERIKVIGKKVWEDSEDFAKKRPASVILQVIANDEVITEHEVNEANNWSYEFETQKYDELGNEIKYHIDERELASKFYEKELTNETTVTNKFKVPDENINLEVMKTWDDNENEALKRPESITLQVKNNGIVVAEQIVSDENNWKYTFKLPKYNETGDEIKYTVDEKEFDGEVRKYYIKNIVGNVITNKFVVPEDKVKIQGKKVWEDTGNVGGKRDTNVILQLKVGENIISEAEVSDKNNWSYEFEAPKYDELGNEIEYYIDERNSNNKFYKKILTDKNTVTNEFVVPEEKTLVKAVKKWEDKNDEYNKRPKSVVLQVYDGDKLIAEEEVSENNNWSYEFKLPKYDELGDEIKYYVDEKTTSKYYEKTVEGYTVINKCIYEPVVDTSDINIFVYIVIFCISITGAIIGFIFVRKKA